MALDTHEWFQNMSSLCFHLHPPELALHCTTSSWLVACHLSPGIQNHLAKTLVHIASSFPRYLKSVLLSLPARPCISNTASPSSLFYSCSSDMGPAVQILAFLRLPLAPFYLFFRRQIEKEFLGYLWLPYIYGPLEIFYHLSRSYSSIAILLVCSTLHSGVLSFNALLLQD